MDFIAGNPKRRRTAKAVRVAGAFCACMLVGQAAWATSWTAGLAASSKGQGQSTTVPASPTGVSASCALVGLKITVTWSAVANATSYTIYQATAASSGPYTQVASGVVGTTWTSGALATGTYWYKVAASYGTNWVGAQSSATGSHTITVVVCT